MQQFCQQAVPQGDAIVAHAELKGCELCIKLDHKVVQCSSKEELFALRM